MNRMRPLTYWQDETRLPGTDRRTRRQILRDAALSLAGASVGLVQVGSAEDVCRDDLAINETTALIFSEQAPLRPDRGLKDARAVWCHLPREPARRVLLYFHGHNGYVTVDAQGRSRMPDWVAGQASARAGASAKFAAPLVYGLDELGPKLKAKEPMVLVPEVSTLATGSFWAKEPAGQYADPREAEVARRGLPASSGLPSATRWWPLRLSPFRERFVRAGLSLRPFWRGNSVGRSGRIVADLTGNRGSDRPMAF